MKSRKATIGSELDLTDAMDIDNQPHRRRKGRLIEYIE